MAEKDRPLTSDEQATYDIGRGKTAALYPSGSQAQRDYIAAGANIHTIGQRDAYEKKAAGELYDLQQKRESDRLLHPENYPNYHRGIKRVPGRYGEEVRAKLEGGERVTRKEDNPDARKPKRLMSRKNTSRSDSRGR